MIAKAAREIILPNEGFVEQLYAYEKRLGIEGERGGREEREGEDEEKGKGSHRKEKEKDRKVKEKEEKKNEKEKKEKGNEGERNLPKFDITDFTEIAVSPDIGFLKKRRGKS